MRSAQEDNWLLDLGDLIHDAQIVVKVPPNLPIHVAQLYETLGVGVEIDRSLPPWTECRPGGWPRHQ